VTSSVPNYVSANTIKSTCIVVALQYARHSSIRLNTFFTKCTSTNIQLLSLLWQQQAWYDRLCRPECNATIFLAKSTKNSRAVCRLTSSNVHQLCEAKKTTKNHLSQSKCLNHNSTPDATVIKWQRDYQVVSN